MRTRASRKKPPSAAVTTTVPVSVENLLTKSGEPLEPAVRRHMEQRFGHDFSKVRVHSDTAADRAARDVSAHAYAVGQQIAFAAGRYSPTTPSGRRLIAHELAHVVQQSGGRAAAGEPSVQRDSKADPKAVAEPATKGAVAKPPKAVPPVEPNAQQHKMIEEARGPAAIRTQIAKFKATGVQGALAYQEARHLAQIKFRWANPNMEQIGEILSRMGAGLVTVHVKVAGAGDAECGVRAGYVRDYRPPIVLCPGFFRSSAEERIQTLIHEMAHVEGIGTSDSSEHYLMVFDCDTPVEFGSADAWANYIDCLSDQPPDEPLDASPPRGERGGKPAPKGSSPKKPTPGRGDAGK